MLTVREYFLSRKEKFRREESTTSCKIMPRSAKMSWNGSFFHHSSDRNAEEPPEVVNKKKGKAKKVPYEAAESGEEEYGPIVHFGFYDRLSSKLPPSYGSLRRLLRK